MGTANCHFLDYIRKAQMAVTLKGLLNIEDKARHDASLTQEHYSAFMAEARKCEENLIGLCMQTA